MTEEHKQKLAEGRVKSLANKQTEPEVIGPGLQPVVPEQPSTTTEDRFGKMETQISSLTSALEKTMMLLQATIKVSDHKPVGSTPSSVSVVTPATINGIIPSSWQEIIDRELGVGFEVDILPSSGGDCILRVQSPLDLDTRLGDERSQKTRDTRCGLIHRATDLSDVGLWVKKFVESIKKTYPQFVPKH